MNAGTEATTESKRYVHCDLFQIGLGELGCRHRSCQHQALLTPQQMRIASMVAEGLASTEIAAELGIARNTVKMHLSAIYRRLGLDHPSLVPHVRLGVYWNCELFQVGLQEISAVA